METKDSSKWARGPAFEGWGEQGDDGLLPLQSSSRNSRLRPGPVQSGRPLLTPEALLGRGLALGQRDSCRVQEGPGSTAGKGQVRHPTPRATTSGCRVPEDLCQETKW